MNSSRIATPGASSADARTFSLSSSRVRRETRARSALRSVRSGVDLAELAGGPLHRFLRAHLAAAGLRVHHRDDELVPGLGGLPVRLAGMAHQARLAGRRDLERRHHWAALLPHRMLLPGARGADRIALL